ncbi:MAG: ADP-ribosylglycohydrolase family protein [Bacillota bacterium]
MSREKERIYGCLLGGAIGDALGYPVEFMRNDEIIDEYGHGGLTDLVQDQKNKAIITDDTQMTLFTAEGILLTFDKEKLVDNIYLAYLRWLATQGYNIPVVEEGWLVNDDRLHQRRAPGNTCISALQSGRMGTAEDPINSSKGCGGVMRVAPIGILCTPDDAFDFGIKSAAITHGHPEGYYSAGAFARIISLLMNSHSLQEAVEDTMEYLETHNGKGETVKLLKKAFDLSKENNEPLHDIKSLGEGWVGEEALGISVYCALRFKDDFRAALVAAINHDGDSDSTGAITGNILGALLGSDGIPEEWVNKIELIDKINMISDRLYYKHQLYYD